MDYERIRILREALGPGAQVSPSKDGAAVNICGEFARDVPASLTFRPSRSTGVAWDLQIDAGSIKHVDRY